MTLILRCARHSDTPANAHTDTVCALIIYRHAFPIIAESGIWLQRCGADSGSVIADASSMAADSRCTGYICAKINTRTRTIIAYVVHCVRVKIITSRSSTFRLVHTFTFQMITMTRIEAL